MIERHHLNPRSVEWFALRDRDLTASSVGAVAGVDLYRTHLDVWAEKSGLVPPLEENPAMWFGRIAEGAVHAALLDRYPEYSIDYPIDLYVRDSELRLGGTPDAIGCLRDRPDEMIVFEFKVISRASHERNWTADRAPLGYQLQTLTNAMLLNAHHGVLAALVYGYQDAELVVHEVKRHAEAEAQIRDIARDFWAAFDEGHAPAPRYERDARTIRELFRPDVEKPAPLDLSSDNRLAELLPQRAVLKDQIAVHAELVKAIDAEIVHKLDGAVAATLPGWKISHSMAHREAYQVAAKDYPVLKVTRTKENAS